ncbi:hypothetical protein OH77DRAFT_175369 [Trametes cingulata]|nr:hypothetical protein OH77DRAFT_175369 [Trametes cingulata]
MHVTTCNQHETSSPHLRTPLTFRTSSSPLISPSQRSPCRPLVHSAGLVTSSAHSMTSSRANRAISDPIRSSKQRRPSVSWQWRRSPCLGRAGQPRERVNGCWASGAATKTGGEAAGGFECLPAVRGNASPSSDERFLRASSSGVVARIYSSGPSVAESFPVRLADAALAPVRPTYPALARRRSSHLAYPAAEGHKE